MRGEPQCTPFDEWRRHGLLVRVVGGDVLEGVQVDTRHHVRQVRLALQRPVDADGRIIPNQRVFGFGVVIIRAFIDELGFYVLSDEAEFVYKCTDYYNPKAEHSLIWNDPTVSIDWPLQGEPNLSPKDLAGKVLAEAVTF